MDFKNDKYMANIQLSAYIAIGIDIIVGIASFIVNWRYSGLKGVMENSEDKLGPLSLPSGFGKIKFFIFTIIIGFGLPLTDTISGEIYLTDLIF